MLVGRHHANNRRSDRMVHTPAHAGICPCLVTSSDAQLQQEQQQEQQQQQVRLAQRFLVMGDHRDKT